MKQIAKILFCILCMNVLGLAVQTNAVVQGAQAAAINPGETSYTVEEYRQEKKEEITSTRFLMEPATSIYGDQLIIDAIVSGIKNKQSEINLTPYVGYMADSRYAGNLYFEMVDKFPELFYTSATSVSTSTLKDGNGALIGCKLYIEYTVDINKIDAMVQAYNNKVKDIKTNYTNISYGDLKNEYIVHDYILENSSYDRATTIPEISHTAYGVLVNGVAVCDGYAKATKQLLNDCGIESEIVINTAEDHAWNYVNIEGQYYYLDVTWDDPVPETNKTKYKHFNLSDTDLSNVQNHSIPTSVYPACTSNDFDFLRKGYPASGYYPKRVGDKLYYTDYVGDLRSMDLKGANNTLVSSGFNFRDFEGYKSKLYVTDYTQDPSTGVWVHIVDSYNLVNGQFKIEYKTEQDIYDIYKKNSDLFIETSDGKINNISIDMREDVNGDGLIDIVDIANVASSYNKVKNSVGYVSARDINGDGIIDIYDITKISMQI